MRTSDGAADSESPEPGFVQGRALTLTSLVLLLAAVATCVGVGSAAHSTRLIDWLRETQFENCWRENLAFLDSSVFIDKGDRMFFEDLPSSDLSQGGVHFFGTSNLAVTMTPWRHPPELGERVSNFALGGATHTDQLNLIRYLTEYEGLLDDGEHTLIVLALFYGNAIDARAGRFSRLFPDKCERYGLFEYDRETGLQPAEVSGLRRWYIGEKARAMGLLRKLKMNLRLRDGQLDVRPEYIGTTQHDTAKYHKNWNGLMGPAWQRGMDSELDALRETIDFVHARGGRLQGVFMPLGSWHASLPYPEAYERRVTELCGELDVPLTDLTHLLADQDFADHSHARIRPAVRCDAVLMGIAADFLGR